VLIFSGISIIIASLIFGAVNRSMAKHKQTGNNTTQNRYGSASTQTGSTAKSADMQTAQSNHDHRAFSWNRSTSSLASSAEFSDGEAAALIYMHEEENLAHDVYITLYSTWNLPIFQNISQSEQTHIEAIKNLLDRYGLPDPSSGQIGVFIDPTLQALFTDLINQGSLSLPEALKVGGQLRR
jgi:hypothetical protein